MRRVLGLGASLIYFWANLAWAAVFWPTWWWLEGWLYRSKVRDAEADAAVAECRASLEVFHASQAPAVTLPVSFYYDSMVSMEKSRLRNLKAFNEGYFGKELP